MTDKLIVPGMVILGGMAIHPYAAAGAAFGCCFYLASPLSVQSWRRVLLAVFSWGLGYSCGAYMFAMNEPRSIGAMMVAASVSALAAVVFSGLYKVAESNGPLPAWLSNILDRVPFLKGGPK